MEPFKFHSPTSIAIYAPPYSGKSTLTRKILEHGDELFTTPPSFTVYCYKEWLPMFDEMKHSVKGLILHKGVPSREQVEKWAQGKHFILVLDDLQQVCEKDREVAEMFTVGSHHLNFTLIYLCHNIFSKGCFSRLINLNSHYNILFRNNRDILQVQTLGCQIFGKQCSYFMDAYNKATSLPWGYILINLHPKTRQNTYKLITHIIPGEMTIVYLLRNEPKNWMEELNSSTHEQGQHKEQHGEFVL